MRKASIVQNHTDFETKLDVMDKVAAQIAARQLGADVRDVLAEGLVLTLAGYWKRWWTKISWTR